MASIVTSPKSRRAVACLAVAGLLSAGAAATVVAVAGPAGAQTTTKIDPNDFIDPVTGQIDIEAYLAAVNAANAQGGGEAEQAGSASTGSLPYTGSNAQDLLIAGLTVVVTGGAVALVASRKRHEFADGTVSVD